jgi:SAM-dependent methyltransferase
MTPEDPTGALARAYNDLPYVGRPNPATHPDHLRVVAALFGVDAAPVPTGRVLELGCGDGANLLPIATAFPAATFVGCDVAERPLALAHRRVRALGLSNVELLLRDFSSLPPHLGTFDYVIAHGLYSWVPSTVRAQLLPSIAQHLAPNGIAFVSYNAYPGCHVRQAAWEMLRYHTRSVDSWPEKLTSARELIALLADPATADEPTDEAIRTELRAMTGRGDSLLGHDDLGQPNDPVYFHQFAADAARCGLAFLAEADLSSTPGPAVTSRVRDALAAMDRLTREQYLDFVRLRRYRESLLCHAQVASWPQMRPVPVAQLWAYASTRLLGSDRDANGRTDDAAGRALEDLLLERWPYAASGPELLQWGESHASIWRDTEASLDALLLRLFAESSINLRFHAPTLVAVGGSHPVAFAPARCAVRDCDVVPNVYHEGVSIGSPAARQLLALLDGGHDRAGIAAAVGEAYSGTEGAARLEAALATLGSMAMLVG